MPNKNLFLVIAMSRSGHHGVMEWIYEQFGPEKFFFNYCDFSSPDSLFENRVQYHYNNRKYYSKISDSWVKHGLVKEKLKEFLPETRDIKTRIFNSEKNLLMMNFENLDPAHLPMSVDDFANHFAPYKNRKCILILRDIYNFIASRIKSGRELTLQDIKLKSAAYAHTITVWKSHAREFLGMTNHLPDKITINFNTWFLDEDYRLELSKKLGCELEVAQWPKVSTYGGGSSFDGMKFKEDALKMSVLERWKEYDQDPIFETIKNDSELIALSERIFGKIWR